MDPEHNFLLHIRGTKRVHLGDAQRAPATIVDLTPGFGLHFPVTAPHFVQNGPEVSLSFSITFRTPDLERRSVVYAVNGELRRRGWQPSPFGVHPRADGLKYTAFRAWRRVRRLADRPA